MRLMLVNPFLAGDFSALNLSLTAVGTYVNQRTDHRASICDLVFHRRRWREHLAERIAAERPDLVGLSCDALYMQYVRQIAAEVHGRHGIPVVLGGHHASTHPEETIAVEGVEAIFLGDAERTLHQYLDRRASGVRCDDIPGVWTRDADGRVTRNGRGQFEPDLDGLPSLDHDLWPDLDRYFELLGSLYEIGSRGCPYRCTFCDAPGLADAVDGRYFRFIDPRRYARDLAESHRRYSGRGLAMFMLYDSVFAIDAAWVRAFTDEYRSLGLARQIGYSVFSRIEHLDDERIQLLASSGCTMVRLGIEAGDERVRADVYGKRFADGQIYDTVRKAHAAGLNLTLYFIFGGPGETQASFRKTIRMAWQLDVARTPFYIYRPFTDAGRAQLDALGGRIDEKRWQDSADISFGAATAGADWGPRTVELYQLTAYALTLMRYLARTLVRLRHRYFIRLARYLRRGTQLGIQVRYLFPYFHVFADETLDRPSIRPQDREAPREWTPAKPASALDQPLNTTVSTRWQSSMS